MGWFNWGKGGPPDDAYSRVTEPERFRPLHDWELEAMARLQSEYEVTRDEGKVMDTELERASLSKPTLKMTPLQGYCAPITIAFTDFPGLGVRFGRWATEWFPSCGCDACDEMPDREFERFTKLLSYVVAGRFLESLHLPHGGDGWRSTEFGSADHCSARKTRRSVSNLDRRVDICSGMAALAAKTGRYGLLLTNPPPMLLKGLPVYQGRRDVVLLISPNNHSITLTLLDCPKFHPLSICGCRSKKLSQDPVQQPNVNSQYSGIHKAQATR